MIIFSSQKLEKAIAKDQLTNWGIAKYLIIYITIPIILGGPIYLVRPVYGYKPPPLSNLFSIAFSILSALVVYHGVKKCFKTNKLIDNINFVERFVILSLPVFIKFIFLFIPFFIFVLILIGFISRSIPSIKLYIYIIFSALGPLLLYVYYSLLHRSFSRLLELVESNKSSTSGSS